MQVISNKNFPHNISVLSSLIKYLFYLIELLFLIVSVFCDHCLGSFKLFNLYLQLLRCWFEYNFSNLFFTIFWLTIFWFFQLLNCYHWGFWLELIFTRCVKFFIHKFTLWELILIFTSADSIWNLYNVAKCDLLSLTTWFIINTTIHGWHVYKRLICIHAYCPFVRWITVQIHFL